MIPENLYQGFLVAQRPIVLLAIPVLIILFLFGRSRTFRVSSLSIFLVMPQSRAKRIMRWIFWRAPLWLMILGIFSGIVAFSEPQSKSVVEVSREVETKADIIIIDVSASMDGKAAGELSRLDVVKIAVGKFLDEYCRKSDSRAEAPFVGLVIFSDQAWVKAMPSRDCNAVRRRVDSLVFKSTTDIEKGLWKGLVLLISFVDKGELINDKEMRQIELSMRERYPYLPEKREEFRRKYQGLSITLFTDGDFPFWAKDRDSALAATSTKIGEGVSINPFNVIDLAHALGIRTYFWSVLEIWPAYKTAFSTPKGLGEAMLVKSFTPERLGELYKGVAQKERGIMTVKEEIVYNPLKSYFIWTAVILFAAGAALYWSGVFSTNATKGGTR